MTGERIRTLRKEMNLTLEELAAEMGISRQALSRYETGVIANIPPGRIEDLAGLLRTTPAYLMGWDNDQNNRDEETVVELFRGVITGLNQTELDIIKDCLELISDRIKKSTGTPVLGFTYKLLGKG